MTYATLGTISHGTLRTVDLLEAFSATLERLAKRSLSDCPRNALHIPAGHLKLCGRVEEALAICNPEDADLDESLQELVSDLEQALSEYAPPLCYFGTLEGDGSEFGFWFSHDSFEQARRDGDLPDSELPAQVCVINDHGNVTIYSVTYTELVSVV